MGAWRYIVPPPSDFWNWFDELIVAGVVLAPLEVREELRRNGREFSAWASSPARSNFFVDVDSDIEAAHRQFLDDAEYRRFLINDDVQTRQGQRHEADPWVISLAAARGLTVVTHETPRRQQSPEAKIPTACQALSIPCTDVHGFMGLMGVRLGVVPAL